MQILIYIGILILAYLVGSIPFGLLIVRLKTGKDVRQIESGRTGGTNAMRAAGFLAGLATGLLDMLKSAAMVWLARWLLPEAYWLHVLAPLAAILGHNYSIFLIERKPDGGYRLRGGAGGAPAAGGAFGLWAPSILFLIPIGAFIVFIIGYASIATMSFAAVAIVVFLVRAILGLSPWQYVAFGILAEALLVWALRPNIRRLRQGTERRVGLFARKSRPNPANSSSGRNHNTLTL